MSKCFFCPLLVLLGVLMTSLMHASPHNPLFKAHVDVGDEAKLQRGAKIYMNYCSGCHSLRFMRYNRMATDLGLTTFAGSIDQDLLFNNLIFTRSRLHDPIKIAMPATSAREWFGVVPPDLSLTARERGPDWIFSYLKSFYLDKTRPFGTNNLLIPGVAMPNVFAPLIGQVIAMRESSNPKSPITHLVLVKKGEINQHEFDSMLEDLVTFLTYVGEPAKLVRYHIGVGVIVFLLAFLIVAYLLKKAYWKKIH
jgi:ubiquinol-cytochrome c reductase cytochrome c1 subunit